MDYYNRKKILNNKYIIKTYYSQREEDILLNNMIFTPLKI